MGALSSDGRLPDEPRAVLPWLRAATMDARRNLAAQFDVIKAAQSRAAYETLLASLLGFYAPLESRLENIPGWDAVGYRWADRAKAPWLRRDLVALGIEPEKIAHNAAGDDRLAPVTRLEALGCVYALEDLTLGGPQALAALKRSSIPADARNFFTGYGSDAGGNWREFCGMLDRLRPDDEQRRVLGHAAAQTFEALARWLEQTTSVP